MRQLHTRDELDEVLAGERAVVFKHSPRCPVSAEVYDDVQRVALSRSDVPFYLIDVIADRPLSRYLAERTGTIHQSPQAIVVDHGQPVWAASHYSITAGELERQLGSG